MTLREQLLELTEPKYMKFTSALMPGVENVLGIRLPVLRSIAKEIAAGDWRAYLAEAEDFYFEERMLQGLVIGYARCEPAEKLAHVARFVPKIDNWAVCDCLSPKAFAGHKPELLENIREWAKSEHVYTCRFGLEMLMTHFLDDDFKPEYLELAADVKLEDYYAKMMVAWFFATALAKQWDAAVVYLQQNRLEPWTHNKTIQKARESYRITAGQKEYLKTLKRTPSVTTSSCQPSAFYLFVSATGGNRFDVPRRGRQ